MILFFVCEVHSSYANSFLLGLALPHTCVYGQLNTFNPTWQFSLRFEHQTCDSEFLKVASALYLVTKKWSSYFRPATYRKKPCHR